MQGFLGAWSLTAGKPIRTHSPVSKHFERGAGATIARLESSTIQLRFRRGLQWLFIANGQALAEPVRCISWASCLAGL